MAFLLTSDIFVPFDFRDFPKFCRAVTSSFTNPFVCISTVLISALNCSRSLDLSPHNFLRWIFTSNQFFPVLCNNQKRKVQESLCWKPAIPHSLPFLKSLTMYPRLARSICSSCSNLLSTGITGVLCHTYLYYFPTDALRQGFSSVGWDPFGGLNGPFTGVAPKITGKHKYLHCDS